ncbi:hypothetical protein SELMODRAFT_272149 [Selaginella moellendorffii]|uniref:Protein EARLY FLOWERING 4 domain-containing protein n=1 Tax=Selaginella moellendorffii TaxID=88036 RepID=D8T4S8_SELML|nr:protein ELF4-LIKE 3 [Selaginella moellendorffii]EFJ08284.1 hypothetical protein SELMODRAFT_272149 [Selaginella moellendorffii]|eukprot:XP_024520211.1 protein ELF4-LIKE 3 [Selaginella moellendorffii]
MDSSLGGAEGKAWGVFQRTFHQVQFLLDHNRLLIKEINVNQESQIPESLSRNVMLIKELNYNIKRVVELYAGLPTSFIRSFSNLPSQVTAATGTYPAEQGLKRARST